MRKDGSDGILEEGDVYFRVFGWKRVGTCICLDKVRIGCAPQCLGGYGKHKYIHVRYKRYNNDTGRQTWHRHNKDEEVTGWWTTNSCII